MLGLALKLLLSQAALNLSNRFPFSNAAPGARRLRRFTLRPTTVLGILQRPLSSKVEAT